MSRQRGVNSADCHSASEFESKSVRRVAVYGARASASVQKKVERLGRLRERGFDPNQTFSEFERDFGKDVRRCLGFEQSSGKDRYDPKDTTHKKAYAEAVPSRFLSEIGRMDYWALSFPDQRGRIGAADDTPESLTGSQHYVPEGRAFDR